MNFRTKFIVLHSLMPDGVLVMHERYESQINCERGIDRSGQVLERGSGAIGALSLGRGPARAYEFYAWARPSRRAAQ